MKQNYFFLAMTLLVLPGCGGGKKIEPEKPTTPDNQIEMPQTDLEYNFDAEIEAFAQEMAKLDMDLMAYNTDDAQNNTAMKPDDMQNNMSIALSDDSLWDEDLLLQAFELNEFKTIAFNQDETIKLTEEQEQIIDFNITHAKKIIEEKKPDQTVHFYITSDASNTEELFTGQCSIAEKRLQLVMDKLVEAGISQDLIVATACDLDDGMIRKDEVRIECSIS